MAPLKSWLSIPPQSHFSIANIPFGIISHSALQRPHPAVAIGDHALDLEIFTAQNGFSGLSVIQPHQAVFSSNTLNAFAALGKPMHSAVRRYIQSVLLEDTPFPAVLKDNATLQSAALIPLKDVTYHLPMQIGDYTDFYAGLHHAYNVGVMFRGPANALQPNYKHLPVGYHGRASSVVVSGTPVRRPNGQILTNPTAEVKTPVFSPSRKLDIELELGAFVCTPNVQGENIPLSAADEHIFGIVLLNDWSARDIQAWEYVPLGPFNAKNFASTISPWVVLTEALEPFRTQGLANDVKQQLDYLNEKGQKNLYDIDLEVQLTTSSGKKATITKVKGDNLLFSFHQMLAHHSIGGCNMNVGDLLGSGTISGTEVEQRGSLLEQTDNGKNPISVDGEKRTFLEDGDSIILRGCCGDKDGQLVGFGDCQGTILPAATLKF
ncbi:hypothetical protein ANO11243_028690 [Dothideomycetidae sp. 11243]|nr:hypothetical protein ANO11243_028690 [fungal sp. No.11243]